MLKLWNLELIFRTVQQGVPYFYFEIVYGLCDVLLLCKGMGSDFTIHINKYMMMMAT